MRWRRPEAIQADYKDNALILTFSLKPQQKTFLKGTTIFGIYDTTLYTAVDFAADSDMATSGETFARCKRKVVRPNPDEILAQNQATLTSMFFNDPMGTNYSQLVATRLKAVPRAGSAYGNSSPSTRVELRSAPRSPMPT